MAVKAQAEITLAHVSSVASVTRYYRLASPSAAPAKPTANPPTGWVLTEPTYKEGQTTVLYSVDMTLLTDGTFIFSNVSKSAAFTASVVAFNKAAAVGTATTPIINANANGLLLSGVYQFFMQLPLDVAAPARPTTYDPTASAEGWTDEKPDMELTMVVWSVTRIDKTNGTFEYTPVVLDADYSATRTLWNEQKSQKDFYANMSLENVYVGPTAPAKPSPGLVWIVTVDGGDEGWRAEDVRIYSAAEGWMTYTTLSGVIVVPGTDGNIPTYIDGNGVDTSQLVAGVVHATTAWFGAIEASRVLVSNLKEVVDENTGNIKTYQEHIAIGNGEIRISSTPIDNTADESSELLLTSSKIEMKVDDVSQVQIIGETSAMITQNSYIEENLRLGEYIQRAIGEGESARIVFNWAGKRVV